MRARSSVGNEQFDPIAQRLDDDLFGEDGNLGREVLRKLGVRLQELVRVSEEPLPDAIEDVLKRLDHDGRRTR